MLAVLSRTKVRFRRLAPFLLVFGLLTSAAVATQVVTSPMAHAIVSAPSWWGGKTCDTNNYPGSYALGASYDGVIACGPGTYNQGGHDVSENFYSGAWGENEWECVELVMRFMYLVYGIAPYSSPGGKDTVANYTGSVLTKVSNNGGSLPTPGDIISVAAAPVDPHTGVSPNPSGHTAVVTGYNYSGSTIISIEVMQQNATSNGWGSLAVSGNMVTGTVLGGSVTGWLHNPNGGSTPHPQHEASTLLGSTTQLFYYNAANGDLRHAWCDSSGWHFENLDGDSASDAGSSYSANVGQTVSTVAYESTLQVFYTAGNGDLRHAWSNSTGWHFENLDGDSGSVAGSGYAPNDGGSISSIVYGGNLYVFYTIGNGDLRMAKDTSSGWSFSNLDGDVGSIAGTAGASGSNVGTAVTSVVDGSALEVFYNVGSNGDLRHAWYNGTSWNFENLDGDSGSVAGSSYRANDGTLSISAVMDASSVLQVFYNGGSGYLRHAWDSSGWHFENLDGDSGSVAGSSYGSNVGDSVQAIVYGTTLQVLYQNLSNGDLRHVWSDSSGWHFENLDGDSSSIAGQKSEYSSNVGSSLTGFVDSNGNLQLFYHSTNTGDIRNSVNDSAGWFFANLDGDSGSIAGSSHGTNVG